MGEVFALAGVEAERSGFDGEGAFNPDEAEVICSAFRTPKLLEKYDFPLQPLGRMHFALYAAPERADLMLSTKIDDWPHMKVAYSPVSQGQESNTDRTDYFKRAGLEPEYAEYHTSAGAVEALKSGKVDALFLYSPYGKRPEGVKEIVPVGARNVYFAVRKDRPELLKRLETAYREWYIDNIDRYDEWREELLGIKRPARRVRVAAYNRGDLFQVTPDGQRSGSVEEWIRALCEVTRWTPDYVYGSYDQSLADVKNGRLDLVGGIGLTPEYAQDFLFPHTPIGILRIYLWTRRNAPYKAGRPDTWNGMKLGAFSGTPTIEMLREQVARSTNGIELVEFGSDRELGEAYSAGEVDACVGIEMPMLAKARALRFYAAHQMYIVCSKDEPELFAELEHALDQAGDNFPKYVRMLSERRYGSHSGMSELSIAETEWLAERKRDPAPVLIDFSPWPYDVLDLKGRPEGLPKMLLNELSRRTGLKFSAPEGTGFETAEAKFLRGDTQLWIPYPATAEEVKYGSVTVFSEPVPTHCAQVLGAKDTRQEFELLAGRETPPELVSILRKTIVGISSEEIQEMFTEAVVAREAEKHLFGLDEDELKQYGALGGLAFFALVTAYGAAMMVMLKRQAARAEEAAMRAEASAQAKTRFLAMMSHELRTPLNAVIGFAEFLARKDLSEEREEEFIQGIITSATALLDLINDILDLSKLETGAMRMRVGGCAVNKLIAELPSIFGYRTQHYGVKLVVKRVGEHEVPDVVLSQQGFRQVLINLVGNSSKFTRDGTITVEYGWEPETPETGTLRLVVRDTGCGISEEKMEKLFDPFVQDIAGRMDGADATTKGTGLGLPIVKRLVDTAGGSISVKSEMGKGTEFTVVLPSLCVAKADEKSAGVAGMAAPEEVKVPEKVLVVDDISVNRKVLGIHLTKLGAADVRYAENGAKALEAMKDWTPDLVLTDMWMPEMDGQQLSEAMAADERLSKVSLVAVTADVEVESTHSVKHFAKILAKPVTNGKLRALFAELEADGGKAGGKGA
jgi:signal transduction histidine kinase/ABC-type amino acid transport substrate-binding protein/ActR/RegA family two-component response regulator